MTEPGKKLEKASEEPRLKARYFVVMMVFLGQVLFFYQQITMSVSIVAMVNSSALHQEQEASGATSCPADSIQPKNDSARKTIQVEGEFLWSPKIQGYLFVSAFFCYFLAMPVFSRFAESYGGKKVLFWCLFLASGFTFLSPFAAQINVYLLILAQSLRGVSQGGIFPASSILVANWCPKQERGISFIFIVNGANVGGVLGSNLSGLLCESTLLGGWKTAFFLSGALGFVVSGMIWFFLHDNPSVHPQISMNELDYIISNQENVLTEKRPKTPWKKLLTSVPVYALSFAYFGEQWMISHFLSINPTFLKTILHYSVEQSGLFAALPFFLSILTALIAGFLSTVLINRNLTSIDKARKFWTLVSGLGYSCCVISIYFVGCNGAVIVTLSVLAYGFAEVSIAGCCVVCNDMSPTFSASINAIACTIGNLAYIILPLIVGHLTDHSQTLEQWHKIFFISISVALSSVLVFAIFGSAEIQPWNDVAEEGESKKEELNMKSVCQSRN